MKYFRFSIFLFFLAIASACWQGPASSTSTAPAAAPEEIPSDNTDLGQDDLTYLPGERFGKLTGSTLEGDLKFLYGERVLPAEISLGEGFMASGYHLFPDTKNEADILFPNEDMGIEEVTIIMRTPEGKWRMPGSPLAIGTSLKDLETMNGEPLTFLGYEWDYGGLVVNWNGGEMEGLGATLSYPDTPNNTPLPDAIMGDQEVRSDADILKGLNGISVAEITVGLDAPEISEDGIPTRTDFAIVPGFRFGAMTSAVLPEDLPLVYGVGNVEPMAYDLPGGVTVPGYRLFAGTNNEVEIGFPDEDKHLEGVEFRITREGSDWHLAGTDIRVGDRLAEVRSVNRKPVMIYDHNMEGGGVVSSWEGGRLAGTSLFFDITKDGRTFTYDDEHNVSSETEEVEKANPKVMMMEVYLER